MLNSIEFTVKTLSPVLLTSDSGDLNTVNTYSYIMGNSILGILANKYIKDNNLKEAHKDELFNKFFLSSDIKFSNAYITGNNKSNETVINYPIPSSIQEVKNEPDRIYDLLNNEEDLDKQTKNIRGFGYLT